MQCYIQKKTKTLARKIYNVYSVNYLTLGVLCKIIVFIKDIIFLFAVNGMIENIHINSIFCVMFLIIFCQNWLFYAIYYLKNNLESLQMTEKKTTFIKRTKRTEN